MGSLRLGMVPLASFNPAHLLKPLAERYPELRFQLSSLSSEQIIDGLGRNQLDLGLCYLDQVNGSYFEVIELASTRMGLLHDTRYFSFEQAELKWETLGELPLGLLNSGMHFRQSIDLSFRSRGLDPTPLLESESSFQLIQAVSAGICCAVMPLASGLEDLSEHLRVIPIAEASVHAPLGLVLRRTEPRSALAEKCFAEARAIFARD
ncbi:aminoethylphosphonate catabolism associated LysR family transcriptional regulator [compost metagenome]